MKVKMANEGGGQNIQIKRMKMKVKRMKMLAKKKQRNRTEDIVK